MTELAEQAAAQGTTYIVSSGDTGSAGCDDLSEASASGPLSVNALASTAFNVAVGGTIFNENGHDSNYWSSTTSTPVTALKYIPENVWNESSTNSTSPSIAAGGGGPSANVPKPFWQAGVQGIPNDGFRDVPDVSLSAAIHDPYLICLAGSCNQGSQRFLAGITITGQSGYNGTINLSSSSCTGLPFGAACSFSPASITGSGQSTLTVTTTAPTTRIAPGSSVSTWIGGSGIFLAGIFVIGAMPRKRRWASAFSVAAIAWLLTVAGCSGGGPGTPTGTSNVTVNLTDGNFKHPTTFTLNVQ
jgi:hypothetical protein